MLGPVTINPSICERAQCLYKHQQTNTVNYNDRKFDQRLMNEFIYVPFIKIHSWNVCMSEINKQNLNK